MKKTFIYLAWVAWLLMPGVAVSPAAAGDTVRVMVMDNLERLTLHIPDEYEVKDDTGVSVAKDGDGTGGGAIELDKDDAKTSGVRVVAGDSVVNINNYALTGVIEVGRNKKGLFRIINELGLEDYIAAVVGEEMSPGWPIEALKAQAVVSRTYAMYRKARCAGQDYDLCSTTNSQVFTGNATEKEGPTRAARETAGEILTYSGEPIESIYHSSCGGETEDTKDVWDRPSPYLKSRDCGCQKESPYKSWERDIPAGDIEKALNDNGYKVSNVTAVKVMKKSRTGRAKLVWIETESVEKTLKGNEFRRIIGYSKLPSTDFTVKRSGSSFIFRGKGAGHGVGLCQWGAKVMADEGRGYMDILAHYYPGAKLEKYSDNEGK